MIRAGRACAVAAAASLLCAGCAAPVVVLTAGASVLQAGATTFINGELESAQVLPMDTVYDASVRAINDLQFKLISQRKDAASASIHAQEVNGRSITISLAAKSPAVTKTNIRVGLMGDQVMSRLIQSEILERCPGGTEQAPAKGQGGDKP